MTYTLQMSVQGNSISGALLWDSLPTDETFAAFGTSPAGTVPSQTGSLLQWTLPSPLAPGNYQVSYQAKVNDFLANGEALINRAQLTANWQAAVTAQAQVLVVGYFTVNIGVYNEAGELIKQIAILQLTQPVVTLQLPSGSALTDLNQALAFYDAGHLMGQWDGTNNVGTLVTNGVYHIKVDNVDSTGAVSSVTQQVTVSRTLSKLTVDIYNEAGEIIRHLYSALSNASSSSPFSLQLSGTVLDAGNNAGGAGTSSSLTVSLGNGVTVGWDGRGDGGDWVSDGQYFVEVHASDGPGNETQVREITVAGSRPSGSFYALPNLLNQGQAKTLLGIASPASLTLGAGIYDMAGELIQRLRGPGGTNQVVWDASGVSSGVYLARLEAQDAQGHLVGKQVMKILVVH